MTLVNRETANVKREMTRDYLAGLTNLQRLIFQPSAFSLLTFSKENQPAAMPTEYVPSPPLLSLFLPTGI